jgi:hypothetical protein
MKHSGHGDEQMTATRRMHHTDTEDIVHTQRIDTDAAEAFLSAEGALAGSDFPSRLAAVLRENTSEQREE